MFVASNKTNLTRKIFTVDQLLYHEEEQVKLISVRFLMYKEQNIYFHNPLLTL